MYPRVFTFRTGLSLTICASLLGPPGLSLLASGQNQSGGRTARPRPGKPAGKLPNLNDVRNESHLRREAPPPIPSTVRSPKNFGKPWDGRRVGDPERRVANRTERGSAGSMLASNTKRTTKRHQTRRAHARPLTTPPPLPDNQFVQNFFRYALARNPFGDEATYWYDQLCVAYAQSQSSLKLAAIEFGRTLFESAGYAARSRDAEWYVYDLYKTYLMREPDAGGWDTWEALVSTHGREYVRRGFEESGEFATLIANIVPSGPATTDAASLISARVDPRNQPATGMLTRDASWSVSLLSLPGRNGLDLGLALSYSSMVWTRAGPYIYFDEDNGFPSPGFRLGFPTVQRKVFNAQTAKNAYLMITGAGRRVELRHFDSNIYDAADSSYLRLTEEGATLRVHSIDGMRLSFSEANGEYRCVEIKDRNGNYITVNYNSLGHITNVTDTLGRVIVFNYDIHANLLSITQSWNGQPSHQWVSFDWSTRPMQASFSDSSLRGIVGTANGAELPVITQVALNDTSHFSFDYTNSLQLSEVKNYFGALERNSTTFVYETPAGDAPRLLESRLSARNWTGYNNVPAQVVTSFSVDANGACVLTAPDGTVYKEYYGTGWQKGLTTRSEVWSGGEMRKWTTTRWTQNDTEVSYENNPRVTETNVYDASGNRRRVTIDYGPYAQFGLPHVVNEFAADGVGEIRQTFTDYNLSQAYLNQRIIGLVSEVQLKNGGQTLSKTTYTYDDPARLQSLPAAATQHDSSYNTSFTARGNVTAVSRWDVNDVDNAAKKLTSYTNYYTTGTPSSATDAAGHQNSIAYADSFSDNVSRTTFAYPTTITDADNNSSYVQYNFDFGATTRTEGPPPEEQSHGTIQTMTYNNLGQLERVTTTNNGAYKRFWYGAEFTASYATVNNIADELYTVEVTDGLQRTIGALSNHPGSDGGYRLVHAVYNVRGRAWLQSNPTEVNSSWAPSGDDEAGIYYTQQTYDWQGRPLVTTNPDGTTREASYSGCGCAGGAVVTLTDEGTLDDGIAKRRQQRVYSDVLGRTVKTEVLNWQGGTVYSSTVNTYNRRDQIEQIHEYAGAEGSGTSQVTTMTYDGYGRLKTQHVPEQTVGANTTWDYNADGTIQKITDGREATATYVYNARHLVSSISYAVPAGSDIAIPSDVTYGYDAAGNRTSMLDGLGSVTYNYNSVSRMTSETRYISQSSTTLIYSISYQYNPAGQLIRITDPNNKTINYTRDSSGRLIAVSGSSFAGVTSYLSDLAYRAWGAVKHGYYGNGKTLDVTYNSRLQATSFEVPTLISKTYDYYASGTLKSSSDALDHRFDRLYRWDHAGRIKEAYSGAEARGEGLTSNRPYKQSYVYDPFGHLTQRTNSSWSLGPATTSDSYTNNRHDSVGQLWQYDADGNLLTMPGTAYTYDAGGRIDTAWSGGSLTFGIDGDGKNVKSVEVVWDPEQEIDVTTYSFTIHSSVLGRVLTEKVTTDDPGSPYAYFSSRTFVYGDSGVIACQESNNSLSEWLWWEHREPSNASYRTSTIDGQPGDHQEIDPTGINQGISDLMFYSIPDEGILAPYPASNNQAQPNTTYSIDGVRVSLDDFIQNLQVFYKGNLGLNEALAKQSANDRNYQRRWVRRGGYADYYHYSTDMAGDDRVITTTHTTRVYFGQWQTTAVSLQPSLWSFFGLQNTTVIEAEKLVGRELDELYKALEGILADTRCRNFIAAILTRAGQYARNNPIETDMLKLFKKVRAQNGFAFGTQYTIGPAGTSVTGYSGVSGSVIKGDAQVLLSSQMFTSLPTLAQVRQWYAYTALGELTHIAGERSWGGNIGSVGYHDTDLARETAIVAAEMGIELGPPPDPRTDVINASSTYYHNAMESICRRS